MHPIQERLLSLTETVNLGRMSLREIGRLVGDESAQKIKHHLEQLVKRGLVIFNKRQGSIVRVRRDFHTRQGGLVAIPIVGSANCGEATVFAEEDIVGYLRLSRGFLPKVEGVFAIKAIGSSMNRANINGKPIEDGDYILIDGDSREPRNGDYVLSVIDGCGNVKRYLRDEKNRQVILYSESSAEYPPIYITLDEAPEYIVNGRVLDVIKQPKPSLDLRIE